MTPTKRIQKYLKKTFFEKRLFCLRTFNVSIGENCLTDNILQRHGLKSLTTPYSHGRSNIDYAIKLEASNYSNLLNRKYLSYEKVGFQTVVRNIHYADSDHIFSEMHCRGFEFTHHDVIQNESHRESYQRKINRMLKYRGKKNFNFFYHYRLNKNQDLDLLFEKAKFFLSFYKNRSRCRFNIITQEIVSDVKNRGIKVTHYAENVRAFIFKTLHLWGGKDQDIFWANIDDNLFKKMFYYLDEMGELSYTQSHSSMTRLMNSI